MEVAGLAFGIIPLSLLIVGIVEDIKKAYQDIRTEFAIQTTLLLADLTRMVGLIKMLIDAMPPSGDRSREVELEKEFLLMKELAHFIYKSTMALNFCL